MANLQEKIAGLFPEATFENADVLRINIPDAKLHRLVETLRDDAELAFDFLITIVGMDWNTSLGCVYYLTSTRTKQIISVKTETTDREKPMLHSISDLYAIAGILEREVYDFFGIIFIGNPDMRRLFLDIDWVGYPLRKDYDMSDPTLNPISIESERQSDFTDTWTEDADGKVSKHERRIFAPDDFVVNIGPQHPATHGVLRFRTAVDGETIKKIDVYTAALRNSARISATPRPSISWTVSTTSRRTTTTTASASASRRPWASRLHAALRSSA